MNRFLIRVLAPINRSYVRFTASNFGLTNRERQRFYKQVSIVESSQSPTKYEILLDQRKLKTPLGNIITIDNEFLALTLAQEWHQQWKNIDLSSMHINSLVNTLIDNPLKFTREQLQEKIMYFLDWDTILYRSDNPEEFRQLQDESWSPIVSSINQEFETNFQSTYELDVKDLVADCDRATIVKYLNNFDRSSLMMILFMTEQLKSVLLTICLLKQFRSVETIASLARLETTFQISRWSNVEYYHDYEVMDTRSKIAAAYVIFYCLNNNIIRTVLNRPSTKI
jgi:ATP synthase mitochondrial F1 complex assembly factor 2